MKARKEINKVIKNNIDEKNIYKCEKCGYKNAKTFLNIFEDIEYRYCSKCLRDFYEKNYSKAILEK